MIVVYIYNAASHSLGVALHSGSGGLCRDTVFDIPKPLFVLENWFVWPLVAIYTEAKSLIDSSVSLFVAVGALKSISCFMRFLSWQFQTIDTLSSSLRAWSLSLQAMRIWLGCVSLSRRSCRSWPGSGLQKTRDAANLSTTRRMWWYLLAHMLGCFRASRHGQILSTITGLTQCLSRPIW